MLAYVGRTNFECFSNRLSPSRLKSQITEKKSIKANKSLVIFFTLSSYHRISNLQITLRKMNKKWTKILEKMHRSGEPFLNFANSLLPETLRTNKVDEGFRENASGNFANSLLPETLGEEFKSKIRGKT